MGFRIKARPDSGFFFVSHFRKPAIKTTKATDNLGANGMANGNGNALTPGRIISICIAITVGVNGWSLVLMQEHGNELAALREEVDRRTDSRYRASDAERDFKLVEFRFERNEQNIQQCLDFIKNHRHEIGVQSLEVAGNVLAH